MLGEFKKILPLSFWLKAAHGLCDLKLTLNFKVVKKRCNNKLVERLIDGKLQQYYNILLAGSGTDVIQWGLLSVIKNVQQFL